MNNPDMALEVKRDDSGRVTSLECKVNRAGRDGKGELEGLEMLMHSLEEVFASEGPEDHTVHVDMHVDIPLMSD